MKVDSACFLGLLIIGVPYLDYAISTKSEYSNAIRVEQFNVLISDLFRNLTSPLFGNGFGNKINVSTSLRDYDSKVGFEMIWLYFLTQTGLIYFTFFLLLNWIIALKVIRFRVLILAYLCYLFYAMWNPQLLDSTHFVVIIILVTLAKFNENYDCHVGKNLLASPPKFKF